jgi:hypothetical protein
MILGLVVAIKHVPINKMCELDDLVRFVEKIVETTIEHFGLTGLLRIGTWMHCEYILTKIARLLIKNTDKQQITLQMITHIGRRARRYYSIKDVFSEMTIYTSHG